MTTINEIEDCIHCPMHEDDEWEFGYCKHPDTMNTLIKIRDLSPFIPSWCPLRASEITIKLLQQ